KEDTPDETQSRTNRERSFQGINIDWQNKSRNSKAIGDLGEEIVIHYEKNKLREYPELASQVCKTADGSGFDIRSFRFDGSEIFIEVKSTPKGIEEPFFISINE